MGATRPRRFLALIGAFSLALAACSSPGSSTPASEPAGSGGTGAAGPVVAGIQLPAPEKTDIKLGNSGSPSANTMHTIYAECTGMPEEFGLNIEWLSFDGGSAAAQALLAEQVDVGDNSGGPAIASLATDSPMIMAYITRDNLTDNLYSQPDIKTADDLKGGSIAISSFGSQSHAGALLALSVLGLTTDDVTITQVGNDAARLAALEAGSVTASMNDATQEDELSGLGLNILVRLADEVQAGEGGNPRTSLTFLTDFVDQYPNTVLDLVAMYTKANHDWMQPENHDTAAQCLADAEEIPLEDATAELDAVLTEPWRPLDGKCDPVVMDFAKQTLLPENPDIADVNAADACTNDFVDQLAELGFQKAIGIEGY
ncbi:MAG TPA: ABC transporter substrate-binding protein [Candidatus Limnocylindria bacterium]|nr:ABC transporter substrate-binding protein [Candidatus Limnocylindria bacterium]